MNDRLVKEAGNALVWRTVQVLGVQGVFYLRMLILARLLSPEDFGMMAIALVSLSLLQSATDFGLIPALVHHPSVAESHYDSAWTLGLMRATIIASMVFAAAPLIAGLFAEPRATSMLRVLAVQPLLEASMSIKVADLTRNFWFRSLAVITLSSALIDTVVASSFAQFWGVWALVAGALAGTGVGVLMSYVIAPHWPRLSINVAAIRPLILYGRWILVRGLLGIAGNCVLQAAISRQLGVAELGLYFMAAKIAYVPHAVATQVVGPVAFPLYARLQSDVQGTRRVFQAIYTGMAGALFPVYAILIALAPSLVIHILGPRWGGAVSALRILAGVGMIVLFEEAVVPILKGVGQPHKIAALTGVELLVVAGLAWSLAGHYGLIGASLAWLAAMTVALFLSGAFAHQVLGPLFAGVRGPLIAIIATSAVGAGVALGLDRLLSGPGGLVTAAFLAVATSWCLLWALDRRFGFGLAAALPRTFPQVAVLFRLLPAAR